MSKYIVKFNRDKCKGCGVCKAICPKHLIVVGSHVNNKGYFPMEIENPEDCIGCTSCALMCPDCAIEIFQKEE